MAIYNLDAILNTYGDEYLILEFNHLFISSSIREEVWLLQRTDDDAMVKKIMQDAEEFDIHDQEVLRFVKSTDKPDRYKGFA